MKQTILCVLFLLLPFAASANKTGSCGENVTYVYEEATHTLTISGIGPMTNYSPPESRAPWSPYISEMEIFNVTIKSGVTTIGNGAFSGCESITSVTIPNSITSIGEGAFYNCRNITSVSIPNSVTSIGDYAFSFCTNLSSASISNNVTHIGIYAFANCFGITSLTIANSVITIGDRAFDSCIGLTSLTIPSSVTSIGNDAFSNCRGLTSINVENGNTIYDSRDNCNAIIKTAENTLIVGCKNTFTPNSVTAIGENAFFNCKELTSVVVPNSVTAIGNNAFHDCDGLTSVTIGSGVTFIGNFAFGYTWGDSKELTDFYCYAEKVPEIGEDPFLYRPIGAATLHVPAGSIDAFKAMEPWKNFKEIVAIGLEPIEEDKTVNYSKDCGITENTDLTGIIMNNIYYSISPDAGGYNVENGCIIITKKTNNEQMAAIEGLDIASEVLKQNFTGIIFKVPAGSGKVIVTAETTGNMLLKVKVGSGEIMEMEPSDKQKVKIPYDIAEESLVYLFAGTKDQNAVRSLQRAGEGLSLRIYDISVEKVEDTSIIGVNTMFEPSDVYSLDGRIVRKSATSLEGLPRGGVYYQWSQSHQITILSFV